MNYLFNAFNNWLGQQFFKAKCWFFDEVILEHGGRTIIGCVSTSVTCSGATVTESAMFPAGVLVLGVTAKVTTAITGASSFDIGDGGDTNRWGSTIGVTAGTVTTPGSFTSTAISYAGAGSVILTANGSDFTGGVVRLTLHYIRMTA